jgi:ABC-type transport system substrate-binding protein
VVKSISKDNQGIAAEYHLASFDDFALGEPYLARVNLRFYPSETELLAAYERGEVESLSAISTEAAATLAARGTRIIDRPLTRIFGVFFNQGESAVLADPAVRQALDTATDRSALVSAILHGYGTPIDRPLPPANATTTGPAASSTPSTTRIAAARAVLERGGWAWDPAAHRWSKKTKGGTLPLAFSLATSDAPELKATAQALKEMWGAVGVQVDLKIYESGDLAKDVIRPREYEALFFGQILGRTPDLFSFWHSKQRLDPGYNIALYTNVGVDKLLEELRASRDLTEQRALANQIATAINRDDPAVFVYSPDFLYALPARIQGVNLPTINTPSDRFALVYQWYAETDKLWKIFKK